MHLPSVLSAEKSGLDEVQIRRAFNAPKDKKVNLFALDKELMEIVEQTYGPVKSRSQNPSQRHFNLTESSDNKKYKGVRPPRYEGKEYLLVDGYNVIFSWESLKEAAQTDIDGARSNLINILCNYQGYKKCEVILVFDAYKVKGSTREVERVNNINIVYTKEAETADAYIEKVSHELVKKHKVRVVTSDALEQLIILGNGALRVSSREFYYEVTQAEEEIRSIISETF